MANDEQYNEKINLDELYIRKREIHLNRLKIYQKILNRAHKKIKITSRRKHSDHFCFFIIPEFLVGVPTYDVAACIAYVMDKLITNNFIVKYTHPNLLFISWKHYIPVYERMEFKKRTGIKIDGLGNVIEEKEKKALEIATVNNIKQIATNKIKKNYKPTSTYKPTGNLIYGNDLIQSIKVKSE